MSASISPTSEIQIAGQVMQSVHCMSLAYYDCGMTNAMLVAIRRDRTPRRDFERPFHYLGAGADYPLARRRVGAKGDLHCASQPRSSGGWGWILDV